MASDKEKAKAIKDSRKKDDDKSPSSDVKKAAPKKEAPDQDDDREEIQGVDPRKFVIVNPDIDDTKMNEAHVNHHARSQTEVDYYIRLGLGDQDHLNFYRQAIMDPTKAMTNPNLRKYVTDVCEQLLDIIWGDTQMKNRLRTILQEKYMRQVDIDNRDRGLPKRNEEYSFKIIKKAMGVK